jgi:hypothetical protein
VPKVNRLIFFAQVVRASISVGRFATDSPSGGPSTTRRFMFVFAGWYRGGAPIGMTSLSYDQRFGGWLNVLA